MINLSQILAYGKFDIKDSTLLLTLFFIQINIKTYQYHNNLILYWRCLKIDKYSKTTNIKRWNLRSL